MSTQLSLLNAFTQGLVCVNTHIHTHTYSFTLTFNSSGFFVHGLFIVEKSLYNCILNYPMSKCIPHVLGRRLMGSSLAGDAAEFGDNAKPGSNRNYLNCISHQNTQ